jgi:peptidoglycan/xylan/chitin deacetylase (PgdA/CDA1 family)
LKRILGSLLLLSAAAGVPWGQTRFTALDLSPQDRLLFQVVADRPGPASYRSLFLAGLPAGPLRELTFYPEFIAPLQRGEGLLLYNRFGAFRSRGELSDFQPIAGLPAFASDGRVQQGKLSPLAVAPDGRYLLYLRPSSAAFGELLLLDVSAEGSQEGRRLIAGGIEIDPASPPAVWAPDSSFFVYCRQGTLYYCSIGQARESSLLAESLRRIGPGRLTSLSQSEGGELYYLTDSRLYRLDGRQLFTRALYQGYLEIGRLVGKIPFRFDPGADRFWVSPHGEQVLLNKGSQNLFLYPLNAEDFTSTGGSYSLPYLYLARNVRPKRVLWSDEAALTVLTESIADGKVVTRLYRLEGSGGSAAFRLLPEEGVQELSLSPDGSRAAALLGDRVALYDQQSWRRAAQHPHPGPLQVVWLSQDELVVAGSSIVELWRPASGSARVLAMAQPEGSAFSADGKAVLARAAGRLYRWELREDGSPGPGGFQELSSGTTTLPALRTLSSSYRVYLEDTPEAFYANRILLRDARLPGTRALLSKGPPALEPFPAREEAPQPPVFDHGSRIRRRELALVFNLIDSVQGLPGILATLREYGLRCTFFVNGEAIRSYPDAVREVAACGHEVGNLFYTYFDMTDTRFRLDREFIKQGLSRTEDEYFAATGRELSLLWHAPYYFVSSELIAASAEMGYTYVGRDVDPLDWVSRQVTETAADIYQPAARLVERAVGRGKPGSIIPVRVGQEEDGRGDYLYQKLDVLIDALIERGYSIVPVSLLIEHAELPE